MNKLRVQSLLECSTRFFAHIIDDLFVLRNQAEEIYHSTTKEAAFDGDPQISVLYFLNCLQALILSAVILTYVLTSHLSSKFDEILSKAYFSICKVFV